MFLAQRKKILVLKLIKLQGKKKKKKLFLKLKNKP